MPKRRFNQNSRSDSYDRPEGAIRQPRSHTGESDRSPDDGGHKNMRLSLEPDLIRIRAEERREERLEKSRGGRVGDQPTTSTKSPPLPLNKPPTTSDGGKEKSSDLPHVRSQAATELIQRKKAAWKLIRFNKKQNNDPTIHTNTNSNANNNSNDTTTSAASTTCNVVADHPTPPPTMISHVVSSALSAEAIRILGLSKFSHSGITSNGSSISMENLLPFDLDEMDFDDLLNGNM